MAINIRDINNAPIKQGIDNMHKAELKQLLVWTRDELRFIATARPHVSVREELFNCEEWLKQIEGHDVLYNTHYSEPGFQHNCNFLVGMAITSVMQARRDKTDAGQKRAATRGLDFVQGVLDAIYQ